jgi:hypothetical protein
LSPASHNQTLYGGSPPSVYAVYEKYLRKLVFFLDWIAFVGMAVCEYKRLF